MISIRILISFAVLFTPVMFANAQETARLSRYDTTLLLMGTRFELCAINENRDSCKQAVRKGIEEIQGIESVISSHSNTSETATINRMAGKEAVVVSDELYRLIKRCRRLSSITDGAFDISFGAICNIYRFDGTMNSLPPSDSVNKYRQLIDYRKISMNDSTGSIFIEKPGMEIGFGAIGKGYAANRAKTIMMLSGAESGFVNASGDILFWGNKPDGRKWDVAIVSPFNRQEMIGSLKVNDMAVVTSGSYEKNFTIEGKTYSHIINPKTGYPVEETVSVSVFCPDAELADGLATAISVLGVDKGIKLVNRLKNVECLIVDSKGTMYQSKQLNIETGTHP